MDEEPLIKKAKFDAEDGNEVGRAELVKEVELYHYPHTKQAVGDPSSTNAKLEIKNNGVLLLAGSDKKINPVKSHSIEAAADVAVNENEKRYGINLLLNRNNRFSGIIKQRYSDFVVRECDKGGNFVYLTNFDHIDSAIDTNKGITGECPIADEILLKKIEEFTQSEDKSKTFMLNADNDKEHRKLVHKYIKDVYKEIETDTAVLDDGSRAIKLSFKCDRTNKPNRKPGWPNDLPKYCHFILFKENRDTMECINVLAKLVHAKASHFSYAGTKDRRATTIQRVSAQNVYSKQLSKLNSKLKNMAVGNFTYKNEGISLGDLSGNSFTIVIRDLNESDEHVDLCCQSLRDQGFINYFGLQRFGTGSIPTHAIGKVLLQSKFDEAINMILQFNESEQNMDRFQSAAKKIWMKTKDAKKALGAVRSRASIEGKVLEQLAKQTGNNYNYYNAFMALPRNNRLMYLHSYQSIIWNGMVSKRIDEFGNIPCVGDLVLNKTPDKDGHLVGNILTESDISMGTYSIYDIVLPLPGYDIIYPENKIGQYYRDTLSSDNINIDNKNKIKDISLPGTYRNIMVRPKDLSWEIEKYDDYKVPLIQTDLEKLLDADGERMLHNQSAEGRHKAVTLKMTLPSSCYATSALREVLLADASYKSQVMLNENFRARNMEKVIESK